MVASRHREPGNERVIVDSSAGRLLVVDDDEAGRELLVTLLEHDGYAVESACDGEEACLRLEAAGPPIDVVLLDWILPGMSGLEVLRRLKRSAALQAIPVILETALSDRETMLEGIAAGAFYYVTKPLDRATLRTLVRAAVDDHSRYRDLQQAFRRGVEAMATLDEATFHLRTVDQASALATLLSQACPDPERAVVGLGELLVNAIEHGNLGITYDEKSRLLAAGEWRAEVERRLKLPEHRGKRVEVRFARSANEIAFTIADQGPGFDWTGYLSVVPERVFHNHGRGIAVARGMSFRSVEYHPPGNCVTARVSREAPGEPAPASAG